MWFVDLPLVIPAITVLAGSQLLQARLLALPPRLGYAERNPNASDRIGFRKRRT